LVSYWVSKSKSHLCTQWGSYLRYLVHPIPVNTLTQSWVLCLQEPPSGHYPECVSDWVYILTPFEIYFAVGVGVFTSDSMNYGLLWCEAVMLCSFVVGIIVLEEAAAFIFCSFNDGGGRFSQHLVSLCQVTWQVITPTKQ
jgi:hypothetical protein